MPKMFRDKSLNVVALFSMKNSWLTKDCVSLWAFGVEIDKFLWDQPHEALLQNLKISNYPDCMLQRMDGSEGHIDQTFFGEKALLQKTPCISF